MQGVIMGFADLHMHTIYSYDGTAPVSAVLKQAKQIGLDVIAITDHDEIKGSLNALGLAHKYGIEVIPGVEVTTAEGDLLALNVTQNIERGLSLIETVLHVRDLGGFCIAPHPMAGGFGMKSLSGHSIIKSLHNPSVARTLIGIETYNATAIDKMSNHYAHRLGKRLGLAKLGNSDAHIVETIGLGMTEFPGHTATDLIKAIRHRKTVVHKQQPWNSAYILLRWAASYIASTFARVVNVSN
jgi:predicted metal-dependent phosphoesterase TrpH